MIVSPLFENSRVASLRIVEDERGVNLVTTRRVIVGRADQPGEISKFRLTPSGPPAPRGLLLGMRPRGGRVTLGGVASTRGDD